MILENPVYTNAVETEKFDEEKANAENKQLTATNTQLNTDKQQLSAEKQVIAEMDEDEYFEYQLENDPRFEERIARAREQKRQGRVTRLEDIEP